ncbi:MAG: hypothetical protein OEW97_06750 [Gammaproteobacteria bacterium]|nr:hypothetical protein [Gammaproteobacteria bacterium]
MQSTFATSRIFNDQDGWYITMRESDAALLSGSKHKIMGVQHLMGPFSSKAKVEEWFESYLSMHAQNRNIDTFIPDSIDTHH